MSNANEVWLTKYNIFKDYVVSNAKLPSSNIKFPNGSDLQQWYSSQRYRFRKGKLDDEKIKLLNSIIGGILVSSASSINVGIYFKYGNHRLISTTLV